MDFGLLYNIFHNPRWFQKVAGGPEYIPLPRASGRNGPRKAEVTTTRLVVTSVADLASAVSVESLRLRSWNNRTQTRTKGVLSNDVWHLWLKESARQKTLNSKNIWAQLQDGCSRWVNNSTFPLMYELAKLALNVVDPCACCWAEPTWSWPNVNFWSLCLFFFSTGLTPDRRSSAAKTSTTGIHGRPVSPHNTVYWHCILGRITYTVSTNLPQFYFFQVGQVQDL